MQATAPGPTRDALEDIGTQIRQGATEASPWIEGLGRFGYAAKGIVYLIVGGLAVLAALGHGGQMTDQRGALSHIAEAPFGRSLLVVVAVGGASGKPATRARASKRTPAAERARRH